MKRILIQLALLISVSSHAQEYYLLAGTYDSPSSEGIYVYRFNSDSGNASLVSFVRTSNASFITVSPGEAFVYAVSEIAKPGGKGGEVKAFAFNKQNGMLTLINTQPSGGDHPCHVETDKKGKWLFVSNYTGGSLSVLPIQPDGSLGIPSTIKYSGAGKDPQRQKSSHVHGAFISPDNTQLLVTDLGTDRIMLYDLDEKKGRLNPSRQAFIATEPGSGPRSLAVGKKNKEVYCIEELTGTFVVYKYKHKKLAPAQRTFTNNKGDNSFPGSAHIQLSADERFLYTSSRAEQNAINVYVRSGDNWQFVERVSSLGKAPRHFSLDPSNKFLLCANQNSNEIVIFNRNTSTGQLTDSGKRISTGKPVCLKWINTK